MEVWVVRRQFLVMRAGAVEEGRALHRDNHAPGNVACIAIITCSEVPQTTRREESTTADIALCWKVRRDTLPVGVLQWSTAAGARAPLRRRCLQYPACGQGSTYFSPWCTQPPWTASLVHLGCRLRSESGRLWLWSPPASGWSPP